jgi:hypothetical protein
VTTSTPRQGLSPIRQASAQVRVVHQGGARHVGPCSERCGGLPAIRVTLDGRCIVDTRPHDGCFARQGGMGVQGMEVRRAS